MAGQRNRSRRRRRRAKLDSEASESSSPPNSSGSSNSNDRTAQRKIPLLDRQQQVTDEKPDLRRRTRDVRAVLPFLLRLISGYYIDAISRLPAAELRTTLARGFLVGGHCYGPLHPVHNIILNSVWYAAAFPFRAAESIDFDVITAESIDFDVITAEAISRLANRSLDGLVAYLRHHCPALSHDDALWHLSLSHGALHGATASARGTLPFGRMELETVPFQDAAQAARHPKPSALAHFATLVLPVVERDVLSLLTGKHGLSSHDIRCLSAMLQPLPLPDAQPPSPPLQPYPQKLSLRISRIINLKRTGLRIWYQTLVDIADAALRKFARQTGARYSLHIIYGQCIHNVKCCNAEQYFHINFMAWPKGQQTQTQTPVRFFAEAHCPPLRNCSEEHITFCCMLIHTQSSSSRADNCYACAMRKRKIDHPDGEEHFGGRPHKTVETDDCDFPTKIDVDYRFFDPDRDIDLVKWHADKMLHVETIYSEPRSKTHSENERGNRAAPAGGCGSFYSLGDDSDDDDDDDEDDDDEDEDEDFIAEQNFKMFCWRYI